MRLTRTSDLWWKNAVIYCLDVETYQDSDGDGHGDFREFVRTARDRGLRVIADLVVNHTSDQHPWFRSARSSRDSPFRDWYVWADEPPADGPQGIVFPDQET